MKKSFLACLLVVMIFFAGCGGNQTSNPSSAPSKDDVTSSDNQSNENSSVQEDTNSDTSEVIDDNVIVDDVIDDSEDSDDFWDDLSWDDSGFGGSVEGEDGKIASYKEIISPKNTAYLLNSISGGADKEANDLRNAINGTEDSLKIKGQKYYVSPNGNDNNDGKTPATAWKTLDNVLLSAFLLKEGDAILLERGGVYRLNSAFVCKSGITYGAYGKGNKPVIYGSSTNYAWGKLWEPSNKKNVWKLNLEKSDAGIIVFDHGKAVGSKKTNVSSLKTEGDFYHNIDDGLLYLYVEGAYPNVKYESIEIGTDTNIMTIPQKSKNITIDNLSLKYSGAHGISVSANASNIKITNCEIGWIGGSYFDPIAKPGARYGNGIQFWLSCENMVVDNCWIYQVYDTGFSYQGQGNLPGTKYKNISLKNTLIEFCSMSIEVWDQTSDTSVVENVELIKNILRCS